MNHNILKTKFQISITIIIFQLIIILMLLLDLSTRPISPYNFVANYVGSRNPIIVDIIRNKKELNTVKQNNSIANHHKAKMGDWVAAYSDGTLYLQSREKINDLVSVEDIYDNKTTFKSYSFVPDAKVTLIETVVLDKIKSDNELNIVKENPMIERNNTADIGDYVMLLPDRTMVLIKKDQPNWTFKPMSKVKQLRIDENNLDETNVSNVKLSDITSKKMIYNNFSITYFSKAILTN